MHLKKLIKSVVLKVNDKLLEKQYIKKINSSFKKLENKQYLSKEQVKEIKTYYKELIGVDVPIAWHQYMFSRTGIYSKQYIPTSLYRVSLMHKANINSYRDAYVDKNMIDVFLPMANHPKYYLKNMNGYYYINDKPVSKEDAITFCSNISNVLIKPSLESHGEGIRKLNVKNGLTNVDNLTIGQLFDRYKKNFSIQEFVDQHELMRRLNPSSVNTLRILTFRSEMEILVLYSVVRIGRDGKEIDNESAGGISTKINPDGTLSKYAYGSPGIDDKVEKTDTGIILEGYKIPSYESAVEMVKKCHLNLPFFDMIGWDIAIDKEGKPVLLEWNIHTELSQSANGPAFGAYTERVLKELWKRKSTLHSK